MYEIGRLCVKIAGRDSAKKCLIVDILDNNFVLIDGQTRRRKCNIFHLEPLATVLKLKKGAQHSEVVDALKKEGIEVTETKPKEKKEKPSKLSKAKAAEPKTEAKPAKTKKAASSEKTESPAKDKKSVKKEAKAEKKTDKKEN